MTTPDVQDRLQRALGAAYTIDRELGGGGMSRVFVADEASLGRKVVVKVLRPELAEGISSERFKREVRLAARLQHPHVVPLLAAGELDGGVLFYTMPFVEGESLRARLDRDGGLPVGDVVRILRDAASALAYAHAQGIVHRDIKPENILLSHGGAVVADFGIAKAISASIEADGADGVHRSTLTAAGTSLGTPAYMSPEQASGDIVDHRSDLYALGVVAYELLAGRPPFQGRNAQQLLSAHATQTPEPIHRRRATVPEALGALVMRLLEKHPADRPQSADEVLRVLEGIADASRATTQSSDPTVVPTRARASRVPAWLIASAIAATAGVVAGVTLGTRRSMPDEPARPVIATLGPPPGFDLRPDASQALSPDGSRLAFVAADARGATSIWLRPLDELAATRVEGTDGGAGPFWSPDGRSLGFFARSELRIVDLSSGARRALCPAPRSGGGAWSSDGTIVYAPDFLSVPLFRVAATGGPCTQLTRYRPGDYDHRRPSMLPDGRRVIFSSYRSNVALVADLATGAITELRAPGNEAQFVPPHWLLFRDPSGSNGNSGPLYAQRLDMERLKPIGETRVLLDRTYGIGAYFRFSATARALVAVRPSSRPWALVWVNGQSAVTDSVVAPTDAGPVVSAANASVSNDSRSVAFGGMGLWIHSRDRNTATRLSAETMPGQAILDPAWSPGDSLIAYATALRGPIMLRLFHVREGRTDSLYSMGRRSIRSADWSPDGGRIAFQSSAGDSAAHDEVWVYTLATRRAARAFPSAGNVSLPRWSPDGRWLAYVSDESGAPEVYVRRSDGAGVGVLVSTAGGDAPRWRADGKELFYRVPDGAIMGVGVTLGDAAILAKPRVVVASPPFNQAVRALTVTPDGRGFIAFGRGEPPVFTLMLDWAAKMEEK
ncbi:MAG TPA: protein kinase [Gemmatimonadaceae bacterium]|nr:protein kinase [Gemmatimonadaceae bacterium]